MGKPQPPEKPRRVVAPLLFALLCLFVWASMLTFDAGDWPSPAQYPNNEPAENACGVVGAVIAYGLSHYLGDGTYPLLVFGTLGALLWFAHGHIVNLPQRVLGLALLVVGTACAVHLVSSPSADALPVGNGGIVGTALGDLLAQRFHGLGTALILLWGLFVGLFLTAEGWVLRLPGAVKRVGRMSGEAIAAARAAATSTAQATAGVATAPGSQQRGGGAVPKINLHRPKPKHGTADNPRQQGLFSDDDAKTEVGDAPQPAAKTAGAAKPKSAAKRRDEPEKPKPADPIVKVMQAPPEPYPREVENWVYPPLSLLHEPEYTFGEQQEALVRSKAKVLERTLEEFRLDAHVVEIDTGPVITMFELQLAAGIKVSQIASLANDIARALKAPAVRVVAPLAGKNTVGIEVPNLDKDVVRLGELMSAAGVKTRNMGLPLFIGKDVSGAALVADLTAMPHMLIAGTTGSGKSVCLNSIITGILMTKRPDHVKLILVDPKMVEMSHFKEVPHLMCPIVTDMHRAESILEWAVTKMEERYELLAEARVRNITAYNDLGRDEIYERFQPTSDDERAQIPVHLPYIMIVIDELADLMMTAAKEVEHHLCRLAQKSRAVGIHIVVATQRPEVKVVTGLIKSNLPCRVAFRVASRMDSRIVLDQNGAEVLMGQGDMLFLPAGSSKLIRSQGTFVDDVELHSVIQWLRDRAEPQFHPELLRMRPKNTGSLEERDALFDDAVRIVLETKRGSVSLLQRRLAVGYARASRLIEQMSEAGIVGDYKGSQAREVSITLDEWETLQQQAPEAHATSDEADEGTDVEDASAEEDDDVDAEEEVDEEEEEEEEDEY